MNPTRTSSFLMANLGAEVSRIISAKNAGDKVMAKEGIRRAEKIIEQILDFPDMKSRASEIDTLSKVIKDIASTKPKAIASQENIISYFIPFALRLVS